MVLGSFPNMLYRIWLLEMFSTLFGLDSRDPIHAIWIDWGYFHALIPRKLVLSQVLSNAPIWSAEWNIYLLIWSTSSIFPTGFPPPPPPFWTRRWPSSEQWTFPLTFCIFKSQTLTVGGDNQRFVSIETFWFFNTEEKNKNKIPGCWCWLPMRRCEACWCGATSPGQSYLTTELNWTEPSSACKSDIPPQLQCLTTLTPLVTTHRNQHQPQVPGGYRRIDWR